RYSGVTDVAVIAVGEGTGDGASHDNPGANDAIVGGSVGQLAQAGTRPGGLGQHDGAAGVIGEVRVELVAVTNRGRVGLGEEARDLGADGQRLGGPGVDRAKVPHPGAGVVGALAGRERNVGQAGGNVIGQAHVGGQVGTAVGQGDGEGDKLGDDGCRVVHRLGHDQVGAWRRFGGAGAVVGGVRVELVGVVDPGHIGQGVGAVHPC